jgi:hypothetical protein
MNSQPTDLSSLVVLRRELLADGLTDSQIQQLIRSGALRRIRHGAYADSSVWDRLSTTDRYRLRVRAVLRTAHPSAVASHVSAAVELGAPVWGLNLDDVHITRMDGRAGRSEAGVVQHRGKLSEDEVERLEGIRVTKPARCAVELTTLGTVEQALVSVNGLLHERRMTVEEFAEAVERHKHWPETLNAGIVLRLCDPRIESVGESRTDFLCWKHHLPRPVPQVEVCEEDGSLFARLDFCWPEFGVFLEFDGKEKYRRFRRRDESLEDYLMREKQREERICALTGWVCVRISWADLEAPLLTARRLHRLLEKRRPVGA